MLIEDRPLKEATYVKFSLAPFQAGSGKCEQLRAKGIPADPLRSRTSANGLAGFMPQGPSGGALEYSEGAQSIRSRALLGS